MAECEGHNKPGEPCDTIFALASGRGRAGVAVLRISGPDAGRCLTALSGLSPAEPRRAKLCALKDPESGEALDRAVVLWFPGPASFTGEDVVELHVHGGPATIEVVCRALSGVPGVRPSEAGEFSLRAFHNGRMDLTEAEGLNDLVLAETEAQRRQALGQLEGAVGARYEDWRARLVAVLAHIEAAIDFVDEELPEGLLHEALARSADIAMEIAAHLSDAGRGERIRSGFEIVILGAPNAGKSSLMNALAREDVAIVSSTAGTTRDIIQVRLDMGGFAVEIADTAGLRDIAAADEIEREGVRRARQRASQADLRVVVVECGADGRAGLSDELIGELRDGDVVVISKVDLLEAGVEPSIAASFEAREAFHVEQDSILTVSNLSGFGLGTLLERLADEVTRRLQGSVAPAITRARHREALVQCASALGAAAERAEGQPDAELIAEDLRIAARALGRVTGRVDVEDILDVVFADFCIGK